MARPSYRPPKDKDSVVWLKNFAAKLPAYQAALGLTANEITSVSADALMWEWTVAWGEAMRTRSQSVTTFKNQLRDGPAGAPAAPPAPPDYGTPPGPVAPDIFGRIGMLVQRLKNHPNYTDTIGRDLGVIATGTTEDPASAKPVLTLSIADGGHVNVGWVKGGMDGLRIEADRGQGWQFLALDTVPDYLDTAPLPPAGQSAAWKYRAIYVLDDQPVGQWSDPVSIAVMGA